jgi:hypothetical protein
MSVRGVCNPFRVDECLMSATQGIRLRRKPWAGEFNAFGVIVIRFAVSQAAAEHKGTM